LGSADEPPMKFDIRVVIGALELHVNRSAIISAVD
jgi:hypothetical protein